MLEKSLASYSPKDLMLILLIHNFFVIEITAGANEIKYECRDCKDLFRMGDRINW